MLLLQALREGVHVQVFLLRKSEDALAVCLAAVEEVIMHLHTLALPGAAEGRLCCEVTILVLLQWEGDEVHLQITLIDEVTQEPGEVIDMELATVAAVVLGIDEEREWSITIADFNDSTTEESLCGQN